MNTAMKMPMMNMPMQMPTMGMGMNMPMAGMMPMMCQMNCSMTDQGMLCMMLPAEGTSMEMLRSMCMMMNDMMANGTPCGMMCNGMPMMSCCGMPMMPMMKFEMAAKGMMLMMMPNGMMSMDMLKSCCDMMNRMMACGMPMTMMCGSMPVMVCMH